MKRNTSKDRIRCTVLIGAMLMIFVYLTGCFLEPKGPTRRASCMNNLKQIALALLNYEYKYHCFPPAGNAATDNPTAQSWRVAILPYLDHQNLYEQYDPNEPWDSPKNKAIAAKMPSLYRCPADINAGDQQTSYVMIVGPKTIGGLGDKGLGLDYIMSHAGATNTLLVIEVPNSGIHWMEPRDLTIDEIVQFFEEHKLEAHPGGFNAAYCDGHIEVLHDITSEIIRALADPEATKKPDR